MNRILTVAAEEKILLNKEPVHTENSNAMARDEVLSFQVAYSFDRKDYGCVELGVVIDSPIAQFITYRQVEYVPCMTPSLPYTTDDYYVSLDPFLCPDVLRPCDKRRPYARANGVWNSIWFTVKGDLPVGKHPVNITLLQGDSDIVMGSVCYTVEVLDFTLGEVDFTYTNWFHYDAIAQYYNLPVFSDRYNELMYDFIKCAVRHGMNMLLTPMFTPALDTRIGSERLTVQLVDVTLNGGSYEFNLDRLVAFMKDVKRFGIKYFEMSHLFTQWGAKAAPKIVASTEDGVRRIFGWDTPASSEEYTSFLKAFLPQLRARLIDEGLYDDCRFHISDEPCDSMLEDYKFAKDLVFSCMPDAIITDALSHYEFYEQGILDHAICATSSIQIFLDNNVPDLWAYYCVGQGHSYLSNRFMAMSGERTRVLGFQLYLNNIKGFLHWGYNFYNSHLSDIPVDPYLMTDACGVFASGDAFIVYPGESGAVDSVRHELFYDAIQDMRLMYRLEQKVGREAAEQLLLDNGFKKTFTDYPHSVDALKKIRARAQELIGA